MSRPRSEAEYLARLIPPSASATAFGRRSLLKGVLGAGAALALPGTLAACGSSSSGAASSSSAGGGAAAPSGTLKVGSNYSDDVPKKAMQAEADAFKAANSGVTVNINTVDHNTFQENINNYLQGKP